MERIISIIHRVKQTKDGAARPTKILIDGGPNYNLETETDELDWLLGRFPTKFVDLDKKENKNHPYPWQTIKDKKEIPQKISSEWDGLKKGDTVLMICGGSGDNFAYAIAKHGKNIGAEIIRIAPIHLKKAREEKSKDSDCQILISLFKNKPELFQEVVPRDLSLIRVRNNYFQRISVMKDRISCGNRISQRLIGKTFLNDEGMYPEGSLENMSKAAKANDELFSSLEKEEKAQSKELERAIHALPVWSKVFEPIEGMGFNIAARIISIIGDIRRFPNKKKFAAYCGLHVLQDGTFPRRRKGQESNWTSVREAMYLLGDQFNRRPGSKWGKKMREYKIKFRVTHPEVLCQQCDKPWEECKNKKTHKRKYSNGHIHRMATWRTLTKFAEELYRDWSNLYNETEKEEIQKQPKENLKLDDTHVLLLEQE